MVVSNRFPFWKLLNNHFEKNLFWKFQNDRFEKKFVLCWKQNDPQNRQSKQKTFVLKNFQNYVYP